MDRTETRNSAGRPACLENSMEGFFGALIQRGRSTFAFRDRTLGRFARSPLPRLFFSALLGWALTVDITLMRRCQTIIECASGLCLGVGCAKRLPVLHTFPVWEAETSPGLQAVQAAGRA